MNGRVCDPTIGRFTSADPYIQAPYNTQSFNRYSYVMNNPLKYVDPSGYYADISYGYSSYSSGFTISISGFTFGGYGYGYHDYFMQQQRAQIRAAQARANAQAVAAAWQRILQAQAQNAAQAQATAQATAAQQTQLNQNLNYQSMNSNSSHLAAGGFIRFQPTNQVPDLDHHDILTAFSVIPVVGGIAGTIDALSYAYEGDYSTAATMLAVGFIPGGKLGMKVVGRGVEKYSGGAYKNMRKPIGDGLDAHHLPSRQSNPSLHPNDGPSIQMDVFEHRLTSSHAYNGREARIYRAEIEDMINAGNMRGAMAREIRDVRRASFEGSGSRTKYNQAMQEMLEYSYSRGMLNK